MATRLVSGNRITEITMQTWNGREYTPDWSGDFFNVGTLKYDEDLDAYEVEDIDYCIEQAEDWQNKEGDFYGEEDPEGVERNIEAYDVDFPPITKDGECLKEVDKDRIEENLAGELSEMIAFGWTDEEAKADKDAFFERIGTYANGLTEEEVWEVWQNVLDIHEEELELLGLKN